MYNKASNTEVRLICDNMYVILYTKLSVFAKWYFIHKALCIYKIPFGITGFFFFQSYFMCILFCHGFRVPWNWSYKQCMLLHGCWELNPGSSVISALNRLAISSAPLFVFLRDGLMLCLSLALTTTVESSSISLLIYISRIKIKISYRCFNFFVCRYFARTYIFVQHACLISVEARRGHHLQC